MRVDRTFAFVDLCGFTAFTDLHGDEESVAVLSRFRSTVRAVCSDFGVRVAKWVGDGAMFVGVDGRQLTSAVLELFRQAAEIGLPLDLHAGIARGAVILFEGDDYTGWAVNLAARLCDMAEASQVWCTEEVAAMAPAWATATPVGDRAVAGIANPVAVVNLAIAAEREPEPAPSV